MGRPPQPTFVEQGWGGETGGRSGSGQGRIAGPIFILIGTAVNSCAVSPEWTSGQECVV